MATSQDFIHKLEVGVGQKVFRAALLVLVVVLVIFGYNWKGYRNMAAPEAMDAAQLARNISEGKGYTTCCIRPFSMYLLRKHNQERGSSPQGSAPGGLSEVRGPHPDLANPPVYPVLLAALMKLLPFHFTIPAKPKPFWFQGGEFSRAQPDFLISAFNQVLFFGLIALVFLLARRLFDFPVAILSAVLLFLTDQYWRFCVSGLSTILLLLIFTGAAWLLVVLEQEGREVLRPRGVVIALAVALGVLVALGCLTRYSFGWLIIPVVIFLVIFGGAHRWIVSPVVAVVFLLVLSPWLIRNQRVSGTFFGTAGYSIMETTWTFPEYKLQRSLAPDLRKVPLRPFTAKLLTNTRAILQNDLPKLGGNWFAAFFLVGLFVRYPHPGIARLRYFILLCLPVLIVAQALGRTHLSEETPEINSENLLVLIAPFTLLYGASLFFLVLDQIELPTRGLRYGILIGFTAVVSLPLLFNFLPPKSTPAGRFYRPPLIQFASSFVRNNELAMSDVPWAVAWYGQVPCVWLTQTTSDFIEINDYHKLVQVFYISMETMDKRFASELFAEEAPWLQLVMQASAPVGERSPKQVNFSIMLPQAGGLTFPLHYLHAGWPAHFLITSTETPVRTP